MARWDVLVLGGGVLGCFAARHLTRWGLRTALLEGREDLCTGITRANTAIVYTGCDTPPGTLKTKLCVEANRNFDDLCAQLGVPFARPGSLMVSCGPGADRVLMRKFRQGEENGVPGLRLLSGAEARAMEPGLTEEVTGALYAPGTGTVNPWELGLAAGENAAANGCAFFLNAQVAAITPDGPDWVVETARGAFRARAVVNCCGLYADRVQELVAEPLLLRERGSAVRETFEAALAARSLAAEPVWQSVSTQVLLQAVLAGLGVSVLPRPLVGELVDRGLLAAVPVEGVDFARQFCIVYHKNKFRSAAFHAFTRLCRSSSLDGSAEEPVPAGFLPPVMPE